MSQIIICKNEFDVEVSKSNENELLANDHHVPFSVHIFDDIFGPYIFSLIFFVSYNIFPLFQTPCDRLAAVCDHVRVSALVPGPGGLTLRRLQA